MSFVESISIVEKSADKLEKAQGQIGEILLWNNNSYIYLHILYYFYLIFIVKKLFYLISDTSIYFLDIYIFWIFYSIF